MIAPALLLALAPQQTWTVDDNGPANFANLPQAVAAVGVGDELLVMPGNYTGFTLTKRLTILGKAGQPRPQISGETVVQGVSSFTFAGLDFRELWIEDVAGHGVVDDCDVGHNGITGFGGTIATFHVETCGRLEVTRTNCQGKTGDDNWVESPGIEVFGSLVSVVDCDLIGGEGGDGFPSGYPGQPGLLVDSGSQVWLTRSSATGGLGGVGLASPGLYDGPDEVGIKLFDSELVLRGSASDVVQSSTNLAISGSNGTVTRSGVTLVPNAISAGLTVIVPSPQEAYLWIDGSDVPGSSKTIHVAAPSGTTGRIGYSVGSGLLPIPGVAGGPLWLNLGTLFQLSSFTASGFALPYSESLTIPTNPGLAGVVVEAQAALFYASGLYLTNPQNLVIRF